MHLSLLLFSLLLLTPLSTAAPSPPLRYSKSRLSRRQATAGVPQEYIEVTRPLPFDSLSPSCTLPVLSHTFANTIDLPPTNASYSAPVNCTWTNAYLQFSGATNGSQYDRIAAVWLSGAELLRTSTPEATEDGVFWSFRKDVTKYTYLLRQSNLTLAVMLENVVDEVYTANFRVNLTFIYYNNGSSNATANRANRRSMIRKLKNVPVPVSSNVNKSLVLNENPADLILPISAAGDEGFWFKIQGESDAIFQGIKIPANTYRAVIEVYVSFHGSDEFWYSNPPDYYIDINNLTTTKGHGAYREILVKLDDNVVGSVIPFPVIFGGGINPVFWEPVVSIGAFDLPSYEIELTPFLGVLLDEKVHYFGFGISDAIPFWLVDANLHLWLDDKADKVQAGPIKFSNPNTCLERESSFYQLDGKFEIEGERKGEFSGWVNSSSGNYTTYVITKLEFENTIKFENNGTYKKVENEVKMRNRIDVKSPSGYVAASIDMVTKYPLKIKSTTLPGSGTGNYLVTTELESSVEVEKKVGNFESKLKNKQECSGWMFVQDHDVLSGSAETSQTYSVKDNSGCYTRKVSVEGGEISTDSENFLCAVAATKGVFG